MKEGSQIASEAGRLLFGWGHPDSKLVVDIIDQILAERDRLATAIRKHKYAKGHDRCWLNDLELYNAIDEPLPDGPELPPREEFLERCARYFDGQNDPLGGDRKE